MGLPVITSPAEALGTNGVPFLYRITADPGVVNQFAASPLPQGLVIDAGTGVISGVPFESGLFAVLLTASEGGPLDLIAIKTLLLTLVNNTIVPEIALDPQNVSAVAGGPASITVRATGALPITYQWLKNGLAIPGANGPTLGWSVVTEADAGDYQVIVSNNAGSVASVVVTLTITVPPFIAVEPLSQSVPAGSPVSFSVSATGSDPLTYAWYFNGSPLPDAVGAQLLVPWVTTANAGDYQVVVSNGVGDAISTTVRLTVQEPLSNSLQLESVAMVSGGVLALEVTGPLDSSYVIWASANLRDWSALSTNRVLDGVLSFRDFSAPAHWQRFYRASLLQ